MRFLYFSFMMNAMRLNNRTPTMGAEMAEDSYVGSWCVRENGEQKIIHQASCMTTTSSTTTCAFTC